MLRMSLYVPKLKMIFGSVPASITAISAFVPTWNDLYTCLAKVFTRLKKPSRFFASIEPELSMTIATSTLAAHLPPGTAEKFRKAIIILIFVFFFRESCGKVFLLQFGLRSARCMRAKIWNYLALELRTLSQSLIQKKAETSFAKCYGIEIQTFYSP